MHPIIQPPADFVNANKPELDRLIARFEELDSILDPLTGELTEELINICQRIIDLEGQYQELEIQTDRKLDAAEAEEQASQKGKP